MRKAFGECTGDEKILRLQECGLNIEDSNTWTDQNCESFKKSNPGYEVEFDEKETQTPVGWSVKCTDERVRLLVVEADRYEKEFNFGCFDSGEGYSYLSLKPDIGDELTLSMPFNISSLYSTFRSSNAKKLILPDWDLSNLYFVGGLFEGNSCVEEIIMRDWKYPAESDKTSLYPVSYKSMFCGCESLKRLSFKSSYLGNIYSKLDEELEDCFKGCRNLENVFFENGSKYADAYIKKIVEASEKEVTIDGIFDYSTWVEIHGGLVLGGKQLTNGRHKIDGCLYEKAGIKGINFVGTLNEGAIASEDRKVEKFYQNNYITQADYSRYKEFLKSLSALNL
ncbi:MAG: hypothetical protein K6E56_06155 [Lachnospiraceae bacterium]|nr:hypothetical protein [Lachnospiraceae bacterium]